MKRFVIAKNSIVTTDLGSKFMSAEDGKNYFVKKDTKLRILDIMYTKDAVLCGIDNTTRQYVIPYTFLVDHCSLVDIKTGKVIEFAFVLQNEWKDNITLHNVAIAALIINAVALIANVCMKVVPLLLH